MGDRNITLFALHTHGDIDFSPSNITNPGAGEETESKGAGSLFGRKKTDAEDDDAGPGGAAEPESESGGKLGALVVALVVLAGIAMVAKKLSGGEDESIDLTESDDL